MKYKFLALAVASLLGVPALSAASPLATERTQNSPSTAQTSKPRPTAQARPASTTHMLNAEFVAYDVKTKTMTVKDDKGQTSSAPLQGRAIKEIGRLHLKAGDHLMVTCRDNAKGEHQAVIDIKPASSKT